jgi:NAD(P)-dependent dehydrogenase (short-subunit alcohol dehydrogenase family)
MLRGYHGRIINITSVSWRDGQRAQAAGAAAKAGIIISPFMARAASRR